MDLKLLAIAFGTVFIAELGDKTQLVALALGAGSKNLGAVLIGVVTGLAVAGALGVLAGRALGALLDPQIMRWVSGCLFIAMGAWTLLKN